MAVETLHITGSPIGEGRERICFVHPDDEHKLVKIQKGDIRTQTRRELALYRRLERRKVTDFSQIPRYYGLVNTNFGPGFVTDLIRDFDGSISKPLHWFFENGYPLEEFLPYLKDLKSYLLENQIIISSDLTRSNVLFRKLSPNRAHLVVIDGLGNHSRINWFDSIKAISNSKIERRWQRFMSELKRRADSMVAASGSAPKQLDAAYRRAR